VRVGGDVEARHGCAGARPSVGGLGAMSGPPGKTVIHLTGKVAVVTGGTRGIGLAVATWMLEHGASVVISGRDADRLNIALKELAPDGAPAVGLVADAGRREDAERLVDTARERFGRLDILVNNAGITRDGLLIRMKDEDWDRVLETNLKGAFLMTRAASKAMVRAKTGGRIINIASTAGAMGNAGQANYSAAKAGLIGLTKATARELAHWGILVNAVAPGLIETDMAAALPVDARDALLAQVPLKRIGTAREVAEMVGFLAGDGAAYVTGQVFHVNGGLYM
jgi:3-oxoacyl-[acyl-carrier protein] reductase